MEFDAHMRLHFDHRCPFCDYSSRTEGRLRCHVKTFHADAGLCSAPPVTDQAAKRKPKIITCQKCGFKAKEKVWNACITIGTGSVVCHMQCNGVGHINAVTLRQGWLVLRWVTFRVYSVKPGCIY